MAKTAAELVHDCVRAQSEVEVGGIYAHYRSPEMLYEVIEIAVQEATEKTCVVYKALYGDTLVWVRDLDLWSSRVIDEKGNQVNRFQRKK